MCQPPKVNKPALIPRRNSRMLGCVAALDNAAGWWPGTITTTATNIAPMAKSFATVNAVCTVLPARTPI